jgi:hypothetical protein
MFRARERLLAAELLRRLRSTILCRVDLSLPAASGWELGVCSYCCWRCVGLREVGDGGGCLLFVNIGRASRLPRGWAAAPLYFLPADRRATCKHRPTGSSSCPKTAGGRQICWPNPSLPHVVSLDEPVGRVRDRYTEEDADDGGMEDLANPRTAFRPPSA